MPPYSAYRDSPPYGTFTMDPPGRLVTWALGYEIAIDFAAGNYVSPSQATTWMLESEMPGRISAVVPGAITYLDYYRRGEPDRRVSAVAGGFDYFRRGAPII